MNKERKILKNSTQNNSHRSVIVAFLNGNNETFGLPDAKLIVDGGDRAKRCASREN